jgi:anti-sigma factor RsiW
VDDEQADHVSLELLADLQAGLLDDATAARLRRRIRDDPALARRYAELEQVRRDLHDLADDTADSDIPDDVTARIGSALRGADPRPARHAVVPRHSARHGARKPRPVVIAAAVAGLVAVGIGTVVVVSGQDEPARTSAGPQAASLTVQRQAGMPWSDQQILRLQGQPPDLGALAAPDRLRSCLEGLGYAPTTAVLGATTLTMHDHAEVLLLLPRPERGSVMALVVAPGCSSTDAGLLADAVIPDAPGPPTPPGR